MAIRHPRPPPAETTRPQKAATTTIRPQRETIQPPAARRAIIRLMALSALELGRMSRRVLLIVVLLVAIADPALANWWIVRASDGKCIVVDIEPTGKDKTVTEVGKNSYQTPEQAEADVKRLCKEFKSGGLC